MDSLRIGLLAALCLAWTGCGAKPAPEAPAPAAEAAVDSAASEPAADEAAAVPESAPAGEYRIVVLGADGHHRGEVADVLAEVAQASRKGSFDKMDLGKKTQFSWTFEGRKITVVDFADHEQFKEGIGEGEWTAAIFVSDPAQNPGNQDEFLKDAVAAGIDRLVVFQVVSDLLEDMEVYDLEAQIWPDRLASSGFATDGMANLQAHVARAAAGDAQERAAFQQLLVAVEKLAR